jgi:hypothetical protein|tara:strand:- start:36 stop:569 length:534 start_codon:yes stop_codon:yes gene_type:complete
MELQNILLNKLIDAKEVSFDKVKESFGNENNLNNKHGKLVVEVLEATNKNLRKWVEAKIPKEVLLKILILRHQHGELEISSSNGSTIEEAINKIMSFGKEYEKKCPNCVRILSKYKKKIHGHIYLATEKPNNLYGYPKTKYRKGSLIFLDGLHRLLAAAYQIKENNYKPIKCFVAFK